MIQGYSGSTAEAYANENGFDFIVLDEETVTTTAPTSTETTTTSTSAEITSQNTSESTSVTSSVATTAVSTTSEKASTKENSPKTGDKGIIGIGITMLSTLGLLCISKRKL